MVSMLATRELRMAKRARLPRRATTHSDDFLACPTTAPGSVEELYRLLNKVERDIGGDAGVIGMSGSLARLDMAKILSAMQIDDQSHFLDVGSGLGRPMLHALHAGAATASGIEFDPIKHAKCQTVISRVLPIADQVRTCCKQGDVLTLSSLEDIQSDITHVFSFWQGINKDAKQAVGRLIFESWHRHGQLRSIAVVQAHQDKICDYMKSLGFPASMNLVKSCQVSMIGSAARFQAYVFLLPVLTRPQSILSSSSSDDTADVPVKTIKESEACISAKRRRRRHTRLRSDLGLCMQDVVLGDYVIERRRTRHFRGESNPVVSAAPAINGSARSLAEFMLQPAMQVDMLCDVSGIQEKNESFSNDISSTASSSLGQSLECT